MLTIVPFQPEHALAMAVQDEQADAAQSMTLDQLKSLAKEPSWSALGFDGEVIACAGVCDMAHPASWDALRVMGKGGVTGVPRSALVGWALLSEDSGPYMTALTRAVRHMVWNGFAPARVILVRDGFVAGERWAGLLGFRRSDASPITVGKSAMGIYERAYHG